MCLRRFFCCIGLVAFAIVARADFKNPDFAFPQTVMANAEDVLRSTDNGVVRLKAVMEIVRAKTAISPDSLSAMADFINSQAAKDTAGDVRALFNLYQAQILSQTDRRSNSDQIGKLVNEALTGAAGWGNRPLTGYSDVVSLPADSKAFFPKLYDFAYSKAISLCPDSADVFLEQVLSLCTPGTPQWARWKCEKQLKYSEIAALYSQYSNGLTGAYLLLNLCRFPSQGDDENRVALLREYLSKNSENLLTKSLQSWLSRLTAPTMEIISPEAMAPGEEFEVKIVHSYTSQIGIEIYRLSDIFNSKSAKNKVKTYKLATSPDAVNDTTVVKVTLADCGNYEIYGVSADIPAKSYKPSAAITVTSWLPYGVLFDNKAVVMVADYTNGVPVKSVTASFVGSNVSSGSVISGVTGSDGFAKFEFAEKKGAARGGFIQLAKGADKVQYRDGLWWNTWNPSGISLSGAVFVSRPLYHPGDTIGWSAVVVEKDFSKYSSGLVADRTFNVELLDANYQPVDTVSVVSDSFGRISGSFAVPSDRLSGQYKINVMNGRNFVCATRVTVSDFKLPVFEINDLNVAQSDSAYVVTGRAVRYTGAVVPDARVEVTFRQAPLWWAFYSQSIAPELKAEGTTRADGTFNVVVPVESVTSSPYGLNYKCEVVVTSINADIATASTSFRTGKPCLLGGTVAGTEADAADAVRLNVRSVGTDLKFTPVEVEWNLSDKYAGRCMTDSTGLTVDWRNVPAGRYDLRIVPIDTARCNTLDLGSVWIYNSKKNELPEDLRLVVPNDIYSDVEKDYVEVLLGVGRDAYVYTFGYGKDNNIVANVQKYAAGFHKAKIPVDGREEQAVTMVTVADGKSYVSTVRVKRKVLDTSIVLRAESWRDKLVPGAGETWTLKLADKGGNGISGALVATLYNDAVNALASMAGWNSLGSILAAPKKSIVQQYAQTNFGLTRFNMTDYRAVVNFSANSPQFLYLPEIYRAEESLQYRSTMRKMESAANLNASAVMAGGTDEIVESEVAMDDAESMPAPAPDGQSAEFDYRDAEVLQAFWLPTITTGADGFATLSFTTPNSIGSWDFRAVAWTKDMRSASMVKTVISSKPIMVEPSLPRFLRRGDKARIGATVINNTDNVSNVTTIVEIFNPIDGNIIKTEKFVNDLNAHEQTVVYIEAQAEVGLSSLGYRVRSFTNKFSDGEQSTIPVMEASTVAIDSEVFYLDDKTGTYTATIPADKKGSGIVAVEYCQNPVWDAVKAIPGLYDAEPATAHAAASSIYAALTARSLYDEYPEISQVLSLWKSNPADSALVSDLTQNEDLKLAMLARTPFVGAANANTEQMERLAATFDSKVIDRILKDATAKLSALQRPDGGFAWGSWASESSVWVTGGVLKTLGALRNKGYMHADGNIVRILNAAFAYLDKKVKVADYEYAYIYSRFPERKPSTLAGRKAIDEVVQGILKNWKQHPTAQKATDALILSAFGNRASANSIIGSLEQFAQNTPKKGVVFPSVNTVDSYVSILDAFSLLRPTSALIDGMRKWLVLRTQSTSDLGAWNPTALVSAIISTGSRWTASPSAATADVYVDGQPLEIDKIEAATGAFSTRLEPSATKRSIKIEYPKGTVAAYGSIVTISDVPLENVSPSSTDGLTIRKQLLVNRGGRLVEADEFVAGERYTVRLTVNNSTDMDYVMIADQRPACFEPVTQMPGWVLLDSVYGYREFTDTETNFFIMSLPKRSYTIDYEVTAAYSGIFASGTATIQSQYAPELTARSGAERITVRP